ncbi:MAG: RNA polymerase sigma factor [Caldisericaceae bacterium]
MDENKLIEEALNNRDAAEQLIRLHYKEVYRYVYRRTFDSNATEDITQEVFIYALKNLSSFRRKAPFIIWLLRIALSHTADYYRKQNKYSELTQEMEESLWSPANPDDSAEELNASRIIYEHLTRIPFSYQEIIRLKFFENRTNKEISEIMQKSPVGVRVTLHRALNALRGQLEGSVTDLGELRLHCGEEKEWPAFTHQIDKEEEIK